MSLRLTTINNTQTDLNFPILPTIPIGASPDLKTFHRDLVLWYDDLVRLLRRDRNETLAKIKELS